jgi:AraC-like DNA-binding protein
MRMLGPFGLACRMRGIDPVPLLAEVGLAPSMFLDNDAQTTHGVFADLLARAEEVTKDPAFGLHAAELVDFGIFAALDQETPWFSVQALATSATLGEGMTRFARLLPLSHAAARYEIADDAVLKDAVAVRYSLEGGSKPPRAMVELAFGIVTGMIRAFTHEPVVLRAVRFAHARGGDLDSYRRVLGVTPDFGAEAHEMVLAKSDWGARLRTARPALAARIEERWLQKRAELSLATTIRERAIRFLGEELERGNATAERLADRLGLSVRTLHRRLRDEGTTHRKLLDDLRRELAERLLVEEGRTVREATTRLGFSEPAALKRAVKRWFGVSPTALRRKHADGGTSHPS